MIEIKSEFIHLRVTPSFKKELLEIVKMEETTVSKLILNLLKEKVTTYVKECK
ncbi:MAG: hypothetical protein ACRC6U_00725 [Fusobacteriaceae bacterium]